MSDDKFSQNLLDLLEDSKSSDTHINLNQSQSTQMGEFKFFPLKTSEERFAASTMRNGISSTSGIFGRTALGRTGSESTLLPPMLSTASPPSPGHPLSGRIDNRRSNKGAHQVQGPNIGLNRTTPLELSENRWVPQIFDNPFPKLTEDFIPFDAVQRRVKALLNKLTLKNLDYISGQIIDYANKSEDERDGRILREVTRLIFESSCDDTRFCAIYAQLCRNMMERVDPEIIDENVKNTEGKFVQGGTLFRKYLLNRCQENFEKGLKVNILFPSNNKGEFDLYYAAAKAKRQNLSLVIFIGELFKLYMLTERIIHEIIKKLLIFPGSPDEEEMECLCNLMKIAGEQLDHVKPNQLKLYQIDHAKAKKYMESYFDRMEEISKLPNLPNRIKFMIMDVIDLRNNAWKPRREINDNIAKWKEESEYLRRTAISGSRGMPKMAEQMSRRRIDPYGSSGNDGWSTVGGSYSQRNKEKVGDLTKFGSINRSKIVHIAPGGILGSLSGEAKGWTKSDNKERDDKPISLSRMNSTTSIYSILNSESSEGRKSSELISSNAQKPYPPTVRKNMPKMEEQMSRRRIDPYGSSGNDGWSTVGESYSQRNKEKVGDLTKFGSVNRSKIVHITPGGILGSLSGGAKGWTKNDNKERDDKPISLSRMNSTTSIYSILNSESSEGRKSSESISSDTQKPYPPTVRKKLILSSRTKDLTPEEPVKLASKSTFKTASSAQTKEELFIKKICNSINNIVEEYFSIWDNLEVITCLKEDIPVEYHSKAIETFVNKVIEKRQRDVDNVMKLFKEIVSSRTCDTDIFEDGFKASLEYLMDIGADAPMAYTFTGQLLSSTGLDLQNITILLKPLEDDVAIVKILKGYANAIKNDENEQEFDLKSVFQKKK